MLFAKDFYQRKVKEFQNLYPEGRNISCVHHVDWAFDFHHAVPENCYELRFLQLDNLQQINGCLLYSNIGSYDHRPSENHTFQLSLSTKKVLWVHKWCEDTQIHELCSNMPEDRGCTGCCSYYDFSFKEGDLLIHDSYSKNPLVESYRQKTKEILDLKYKTLEEIAVSRKYKHGWIFYRMREPVAEIETLWQSIGCYITYYYKAKSYMINFQCYHRKETLRKHQDKYDF